MRLIADSGSTKTAWKLVGRAEGPKEIYTGGINPFFRSTSDIYNELYSKLLPETATTVSEVWFYGTGIVNDEKGRIVSDAIQQLYPQANISVFSDMTGACRALFGHRKGIVCIMGTGSNSCCWDGEKVTANVSPLGFILGDEGSGAVMGRQLIGDYLKEMMPDELRAKFAQRFQFTRDEVLNRVYREARPNQYLATFVPFLSENMAHPWCNGFLLRNFTAFVERNLMKLPDYQQYNIGFVGSVAWHFRQQLSEVLKNHHLAEPVIMKDPIDGFVSYHIEK